MSDQIDEVIQDIMALGVTGPIDDPDFSQQIKDAQKRRDNLYKQQSKDSPDYGYSPQNPIMTSSVKNSNEYLSKLRTADGLKLTWERVGSICIDSLYGSKDIMVDCYQLMLDGEHYRKIYLCPYGRNSDYAPRGMYLEATGEQKRNEDTESKETGLEDTNDKIIYTDVVYSKKNQKTDDTDNKDSGLRLTDQVMAKETKVPEDISLETETGLVIETVKCSKCHKSIRKAAYFCRFCGAQNLPLEHSEKENETTREARNNWQVRIAVITLILIILCGIVYCVITYVLPKEGEIANDNHSTSSISSSTDATTSIAKDLKEKRANDIIPPSGKQANRIELYQLGQIVKYGRYEQDGDTSSPEILDWVVVKIDDENKVVQLITKNVIEVLAYGKNKNTKWSDSTAREWLNQDFLDDAFTELEIKHILPADVSNSNDKETTDKVFLLSYNGIDALLPENSQYRIAKSTMHVKQQRSIIVNDDGACSWGTRDPNTKIDANGKKQSMQPNSFIGIRPSIFLKIGESVPAYID